MRRGVFQFNFFFLLFFLGSITLSFAQPIEFHKDDRILIIAPHPDDETVGTAGVIQSAQKTGAGVRIVYLTHGDYNEIASLFYQKKPLVLKSDFIKSGQIRRSEAVAAMKTLGLEEKNLIFLGYPDFGTLSIWRSHWGEARSLTSFPTGLNHVPYENDFSYGRPFKGESVVHDFEKILLVFQPTFVFVTPPFDLNPDHKAAYLYLNTALLNLSGKMTLPKVYLYPVHVARWPAPKKYRPGDALLPPFHIQGGRKLNWISFDLGPEETALKREALAKYKSHISYSRNFLLSFARKNELFLEYPYEKLGGAAIGAGNVEYRVEGNNFLVDVRFSNPFDRLGILNVEVFGYKKEIPFSDMPKLTLRLFGGRVFVKDGPKSVRDSGASYQVKKNTVTVKIPLPLLKNPDHLFVAAHSTQERLSFEFESWKVLEITK